MAKRMFGRRWFADADDGVAWSGIAADPAESSPAARTTTVRRRLATPDTLSPGMLRRPETSRG
jgi:hypothetical protein